MTTGFPDPFSDAVVKEVKALIEAGEVKNLTTALDAQISSVHVPEWYQSHQVSRIYGVLLELQISMPDRAAQNKIAALLIHMKMKYQDQLVTE